MPSLCLHTVSERLCSMKLLAAMRYILGQVVRKQAKQSPAERAALGGGLLSGKVTITFTPGTISQSHCSTPNTTYFSRPSRS